MKDKKRLSKAANHFAKGFSHLKKMALGAEHQEKVRHHQEPLLEYLGRIGADIGNPSTYTGNEDGQPVVE